MRRRRTAATVLAALVCASCAGNDPKTPAPMGTSAAGVVASEPTTEDAPMTTASPASATTPPQAPEFAASIAPIDDTNADRLHASWRPVCPVPLRDLRLVTLTHWDDAGAIRTGELVVHADSADAIVSVFHRLFDLHFPIARMELVDVFGGDDERSMAANNTSAFNCREISGQPGTWSEHAYGRAIDINPLVNPWVRGRTVDPPEGAAYADRSRRVAGGVYDGDEVVQAFAAIGWKWGGAWQGSKDYQHFSASGR